MKHGRIIFVTAVGLMCLLLGILATQRELHSKRHSQPSEAEAITMVKEHYPELKDYPSTTLPPRSIRTEQSAEGWYIAFIQEGSGRPVIAARCYLVNQEVSIKGTYTLQPGPEDTKVFSARSCKAE